MRLSTKQALSALSIALFIMSSAYALDKQVLTPLLKKIFGSSSDDIRKLIDSKSVAKSEATADANLQPGDIKVSFDVDAITQKSKKRPQLIRQGQEGGRHVGVVAKDEHGSKYVVEIPRSSTCNHEFQGKVPYVVLRRKKSSVISLEAYQSRVNTLLNKMSEIGFNYDVELESSLPLMSKSEIRNLKNRIFDWDGSAKTKPKIPDLYCSELVQAIDLLLGDEENSKPVFDEDLGLSLGKVLDIGIKTQQAAGVTDELIATSGADELVAYYGVSSSELEKLKSQLKELKSISKEVRGDVGKIKRIEERIEFNKHLLQLRPQIKEMLALRIQNMGIKDAGVAPRIRRLIGGVDLVDAIKDPIDFIKEFLLKYNIDKKLNQLVFRPVDILRSLTSDDSAYEIVSYYDGTKPSMCSKSKSQSGSKTTQ